MLEVRNLTRRFGDRLAIDDVSFPVHDGRLTGFVGGNGAGKTTTMRIIMGVLAATSGSILLDGREIGPDERRHFGYMPEERGLYPKMKTAEQIAYLARLHGEDKATAMERARDLLTRLGLGERLDDPVENLSLGNQQRAQIAAALINRPNVLILDEPFSGLDPLAVETVLGVLSEAAADGVPVIFSSHQLDLVERLCDDLVIISQGTVRAAGDRESLRQEFGTTRYELVTTGDAGWVRTVPGVAVTDFAGGYALFEAPEAVAQDVLRRAVDAGPVTSFRPVLPTLSEIFREVHTHASTEEAA